MVLIFLGLVCLLCKHIDTVILSLTVVLAYYYSDLCCNLTSARCILYLVLYCVIVRFSSNYESCECNRHNKRQKTFIYFNTGRPVLGYKARVIATIQWVAYMLAAN